MQEKIQLEFDNALYIVSALGEWYQITNREDVTRWTSGDWDDYYFVFERNAGNEGSMRLEFIALGKKTYMNLFKPNRLTQCGKIIWSSTIRSECPKLPIDELKNMLYKIGIQIKDSSVYSQPKNTGFKYQYKKSSNLYEDIFNMAYEYIGLQNKAGNVEYDDATIDEYVGNLYDGRYNDFEDLFVKSLINYYTDMPYGIKIRLQEYIKHDNNPLCPKECIGTALVQAFIKYDYVDIHHKEYEGHI